MAKHITAKEGRELIILYLFFQILKNPGFYKMNKQQTINLKTRKKILHRCEILEYMGDDAICSDYDQIPFDELMKDYGWVLDKANDDLDKFKLGLTEVK